MRVKVEGDCGLRQGFDWRAIVVYRARCNCIQGLNLCPICENVVCIFVCVDGQRIKGSLPMREIVTEASVPFTGLRRRHLVRFPIDFSLQWGSHCNESVFNGCTWENREILQEEDKIKLETEPAKAPIDHITFQLHHLLYEKNCYFEAIKTCRDFRSKYPDIDFVAEEAFFQDIPQELQSDPALRDDSHILMIQRLKFELHQCKELLQQREIVEARMKVLQENIANRRKFLGAVELERVWSGKDALTMAKQFAMKEAGNEPTQEGNDLAAPEHPAAQSSQTNSPTSPQQGGQTQQDVALPALPAQWTFLRSPTFTPTSPGRAVSESSTRSAGQRSVSPSNTPPISPGAMPSSQRSSFGSFKGFNSPLALPVRVGSLSSPSSPIYANSPGMNFPNSPGRHGTSHGGGGSRSTPTSPGVHAPSRGWTGMLSAPTSPETYGTSSTSPRTYTLYPGVAEFQSSLISGLDATSRTSPRGGREYTGEQSLVEDRTSLWNSSAVTVNLPKHPVRRNGQQEPAKSRSRWDGVVARNGAKGAKRPQKHTSTVSDERESSDRQRTGGGNAVPLPLSPRSQIVSFEQIVAGRDGSPPTDNTLMKFFFKCREIEHLNKFLALQKKRFLESFNTEAEKCFHMILSEAGQGLSSMISTLCTAWLLENTMASASVKWHPIPVMNMCQKDMWQHRDAAWLFHVCGIEANAVLFLDEITSNNETVVAGRVKRAVTGQDILVTKKEVASSCTIVSEKFRQDAPKLLQARYMKTLLLAGILVDTKNLSTGSSRDKQQATILLVGAGSLGRNGFYNHLVNIRDEKYVTLFIKEIYGDSNVLAGEKSDRKGQGVEAAKAVRAILPNDEKSLRPAPLAIPEASTAAGEFSAPISLAASAPSQESAGKLNRKSESAVTNDDDSKLSSSRKEGSKWSRKSESAAINDDDSKLSSSRKEGSKWSRKSESAAINDDDSKLSSSRKEGSKWSRKSESAATNDDDRMLSSSRKEGSKWGRKSESAAINDDDSKLSSSRKEGLKWSRKSESAATNDDDSKVSSFRKDSSKCSRKSESEVKMDVVSRSSSTKKEGSKSPVRAPESSKISLALRRLRNCVSPQ